MPRICRKLCHGGFVSRNPTITTSVLVSSSVGREWEGRICTFESRGASLRLKWIYGSPCSQRHEDLQQHDSSRVYSRLAFGLCVLLRESLLGTLLPTSQHGAGAGRPAIFDALMSRDLRG